MKLIGIPLLIVTFMAVFAGCANENPDLVNPPPGLDSIYVRFINFASDRTPRSLSLENAASTAAIGYGQASAIIESPEDSARLIVKNGQITELTTPVRFRFTRSSFHTVIAVPSSNNASVSRPFDTIIVLNTLAVPLSASVTDASVRICNISPDTAHTYSVKLGCQNGTEIARDGGFRSISAYRDIPSGKTGITLMRNSVSGAEPEVVGLFEATFTPRSSYTFIVYDESSGKSGLLMLDDRNGTTSALYALPPVAARIAEIQTYNFSRRKLTALKISSGAGETIADGLPPLGIGEVKQVSACGSLTADQIIALTNSGDTAGRGYLSVEVLRKYAAFWFDIPASTGFVPVIVGKTDVSSADSAIITVVNGAFSQSAITVSLGARTNAARKAGYSSGEILCSRLGAGSASSPAMLSPGELPVTVFSTSLPAQMLSAATAQVQAGKQYYLILRDNAAVTGGIEAALVESTVANAQAEILERSGFVQAINASDNDITVGFDRVLSGVRILQAGAVATILPSGTRILSAGSTTANIPAGSDSNIMAVVAGQAQNTDIFTISSPVGASRPGFLRRRYVNAAADITGMTVVFDSASAPPLAENIAYRSSFDEPSINYERRISVYFLESATKRPLDSMQNTLMPLGRNYSLILTGNAGKYRVVMQQEF
ncbi:MAG: DUF4397 domain-containing protein [Bacteroidetes bacterium]|nr:DUF4397 domain-containing protein [Bacteroidota bacterium]MCZ2132103.1 DUF4397 domain-containing protein [Bacteroidota bacterium]